MKSIAPAIAGQLLVVIMIVVGAAIIMKLNLIGMWILEGLQ